MQEHTLHYSKMQKLLSRFIRADMLPRHLVLLSQRFLFDEEEDDHLWQYTELYRTVLYLKDVMVINQLRTIQELEYYYEEKKTSIHLFISSIRLPEQPWSLESRFKSVNPQAHVERPVVPGHEATHPVATCMTLVLRKACTGTAVQEPNIMNSFVPYIYPNRIEVKDLHTCRKSENTSCALQDYR